LFPKSATQQEPSLAFTETDWWEEKPLTWVSTLPFAARCMMLLPVAAQQEPSVGFTEADHGIPNGLTHASTTFSSAAAAGRGSIQRRDSAATNQRCYFITYSLPPRRTSANAPLLRTR
jgi:hypothetical protein